MFTIKTVAQATGLSIETLRAWERRYGVVSPRRDSNGIRQYSPDNILRLQMLREATEQGHAISELARTTRGGISKLLSKDLAPFDVSAKGFIKEILAAAKAYQPERCNRLIRFALALMPVNEVVETIISVALKQADRKFIQGKFTLAQERIVCMVVRQVLGGIVESYNRVVADRPLVIATLSHEVQEIRVLLVTLLATSAGLRCLYLGHGVSMKDIRIFCEKVGARGVALVTGSTQLVKKTRLEATIKQLPNDIPIFVSGQALRPIKRIPSGSRIRLIRDYQSLYEAFLQEASAAATAG